MRGTYILLIGVSLLLAVTAHDRQEVIPPNKCLPGHSCFPSRQALAEFEATLTGSVVTPLDSAYAGLVRMRNTRQIRHPYIIVLAGNAADVQKAMLFARKYHLLVTSQASDREITGRSTFDGSLQINLSNLRGVTRLFNATVRSPEGEITAAAGTTWEDVYTQARTINRDVVASSFIQKAIGDTVGDGGIGPLVKVYGLVTDNLLEAQIVTADGSLITVTEYNVVVDFGDGLVRRTFDRTFFAALCSGGVGPFGVVVSYTFKLYRSPPSIVQLVARYKLWDSGNYIGADILKFFTSAISSLPVTWGGYMYLSGATSQTDIATKGELIIDMFYYNSWNAESSFNFADAILSFDAIDSLIELNRFNISSVLEFERRQQYSRADSRFYSFNVMVQEEKIGQTTDGLDALNDALLHVLNNPTVESTFFCSGNLLGGALQTEPRNVSFVNPAIRNASVALSCLLDYPGRGELDTFYTDRALDFRKLLSPFGEGKYRAAAEPDLPNWKRQYHGASYSHLIDVKIKYDIDNFLWCHNCVGSDFRLSCPLKKGRSQFIDMLTSGIDAQRRERERHDARRPYIRQMSLF